jgi:hypothetical protein
MNVKTAAIRLCLAAAVTMASPVIAGASPARGHVYVEQSLIELYRSCREQSYRIWPQGNVEPGVGRGRGYLFNACVLNGGTIPGRPLG